MQEWIDTVLESYRLENNGPSSPLEHAKILALESLFKFLNHPQSWVKIAEFALNETRRMYTLKIDKLKIDFFFWSNVETQFQTHSRFLLRPQATN